MSISPWIFLLMIPGMAACGGVSGENSKSPSPKTPIQGGLLEFALASFDGKIMKGRVLLGASIETFSLDSRLVEDVGIEVRDIRACDKPDRLEYKAFDWVMDAPSPDQIVVLRPGYWYGRDVKFPLFDEQTKPGLPDCFEGKMMAWTLDGRLAATLPIRVAKK